jgi:hypothetical protein
MRVTGSKSKLTKIKLVLTVVSVVLAAVGGATAQTGRQRIFSAGATASALPCPLTGAYRIDVVESDKLYSVVKDATGTVPFGEQQRFFMDLSTRLTPPDMLAIECQGNRVTVGSSRAPRINYLADGRTRRERTPSGNFVNSRVELGGDSLTFVSHGNAEDNVNVLFRSIDGGRRLRVTRRIYAEQLTEPIVIQTVYNKIADTVEWEIYDGRNLARQIPANTKPPVPRPAISRSAGVVGGDRVIALRNSLGDWLEATNRRDIEGQMHFYMPELKAYYLTRNTPQSLVRAEKKRVFAGVTSVDIRAREPEIVFQDGGRVAVMRFVKEYRVAQRTGIRSGAVIQELRWQQTNDGWRIFSERDVRVLR